MRISVVDNFQGEENRIILLSLVRSNDKNDIGYLAMENRISVALSRAREGLFIIGNMQLLSACSKTWNLINNELMSQQSIGDYLPLLCTRHGCVTEIRNVTDFGLLKYGGCMNSCDFLLECGHACSSVCHTELFDHFCDYCEKIK